MGMLVFATLFVCGGEYTAHDVHRWSSVIGEEHSQVIVVVGRCSLELPPNAMVYRVTFGEPAVGKYRHLHAKYHLWNLPYNRVAYYDLDVLLKRPVDVCANMCQSKFCAVQELATSDFNAGFMVLTPNYTVANQLFSMGTSHQTFAEQDTLNKYFGGEWEHLPKECNWFFYNENHPTAKEDPNVLMVHLRGQ